MQELRTTDSRDVEALRARFGADGYLLVRALVDVPRVEQLAAGVLTILEEQGLHERGADAVDRFRSTRIAYYTALQRLEAFHALAQDDALQRVVRILVGDDAFAHPRKLLRALLPNMPELTTPPHQDFPYIRGTERAVTAWMPLRSCRGREGALRVLVGSHTGEILPSKPSSTVAGAQVDVDDRDPAWATGDFEPGDVLLFHSRTVHGATPNTSDRIRISADCRYQSASEPVMADALKPTGHPLVPDWPELLANESWPCERWIFVPRNVRIADEPAGPRRSSAA